MQSDYAPYYRAIKKAAKDLNLDSKLIDSIYRAYCKLIIDKISTLPLKNEDLSEKEFNELQTNINLPSLGKIYTNWQIIKNQKQKIIYVQKTKKNQTVKH